MSGNWGLIDLETPQDAYSMASYTDGSSWQLVFSDEFNTDGRTFYPGDDPYWEAVDLHYWQVIILSEHPLFGKHVSHRYCLHRQTISSGMTRLLL